MWMDALFLKFDIKTWILEISHLCNFITLWSIWCLSNKVDFNNMDPN